MDTRSTGKRVAGGLTVALGVAGLAVSGVLSGVLLNSTHTSSSTAGTSGTNGTSGSTGGESSDDSGTGSSGSSDSGSSNSGSSGVNILPGQGGGTSGQSTGS